MAALLLTAISFTLSGQVGAQSKWVVEKTFHVGGEGGWDYITVDSANHRLYVPRSTHTMVIDADSGKTIGDIPGQKHNHGVALVPEAGRGFISDGNGAVVIFDLKTNAVLGTITAQPDADGIIYDKASGLVLVVSGDNGVLMTLKPNVDPKTGSIDPPIELGGKPEFLASDGAGKVISIWRIRTKSRSSTSRGGKYWHTGRWHRVAHRVGLSIDPTKRRLFIGCRNPQKLIVMSTDDGKVIADLPIGAGVDATRFDGGEAFASCRDGKLNVAAENMSGKFEIVQTVTTAVGARTMDVDPGTQKIYLPTAEFEEQKPGASGRPAARPGSLYDPGRGAALVITSWKPGEEQRAVRYV